MSTSETPPDAVPEPSRPPPEGPLSRRTADLPVRRVILLEDRAQVVREAPVHLPPGQHRIEVPDVSPVIADRTLTARFEGSGATVLHARLRRRARLPRTGDENGDIAPHIAALESRLHEAEDTLDALRCARQRAARATDQLETALAHDLEEMQEDTAWSRVKPEDWLERLAAVRERALAARHRQSALALEVEEQEQTVEDLREQLEHREPPARELAARLEIDVQVQHEGEGILQCRYVVPNACWRPAHRAELLATGEDEFRLRFGFEACVWQHTGEPWTDAALTFSTRRRSAGSEPPPLSEDLLRLKSRSDEVQVETRDQEIQTTGLGGEPAFRDRVPGIDDGGEPLHLRAAHRHTLPSDGRPHRVPLHTFEAPAERRLRALPERVSSVIVACRAENRAPHPLLAGPVELFTEHGNVGRTRIDFVAPGERFEIGFGPEPALRLRRREERTDLEPGVLSRSRSTRVDVSVELFNIGTRPRKLEVQERIPVSELDAVQVRFDARESTPGATPDPDGFLRWPVELGPGERTRIRCRYALVKHKDVRGL